MIYIAVIETHVARVLGILKKKHRRRWKWVGLKMPNSLLCAAIYLMLIRVVHEDSVSREALNSFQVNINHFTIPIWPSSWIVQFDSA